MRSLPRLLDVNEGRSLAEISSFESVNIAKCPSILRLSSPPCDPRQLNRFGDDVVPNRICDWLTVLVNKTWQTARRNAEIFLCAAQAALDLSTVF